jgi:myo-inositol-1(or 4)-monophosphatase
MIRAAYGGILTTHAKADLDFATNADLDAERAILEVIAAARPDDGLKGEETGTHGVSGSRRWLVDPLCGTLNFAAQTPLVAVNVALVDGSDDRDMEAVTLACASADPLSGETFWACPQGAFVRRGGVDKPLRPTSRSRLVDVNCDGPSDRPIVGPQLIADARLRAEFGPRVVSTTLALAWVAAGRRAAYVSDGTFVDNVHFAAGIEVCRGAWCIVTDFAGDPVTSGRGLIVAADTEVHERLVDIIQPHLARIAR